MANKVVVGIIGTSDPSRVANTIATTGLDHANVRILTADDRSAEHDSAAVTFVHVAEMQGSNSLADDMTRNTGVIPDYGGTSVPGINDESGSFDAFEHPEVLDHLDGVSLPEGDAEFYNEAIDDGRCVAISTCDDVTAAGTKHAFEKAGLSDIRTF
ncbi:MAG: hypothetical protein ACREMP_06145 [Candidatus Tyrphobacter sp.]